MDMEGKHAMTPQTYRGEPSRGSELTEAFAGAFSVAGRAQSPSSVEKEIRPVIAGEGVGERLC